MAQIPMGNFGQVVAQPGQAINVPKLDVSSGAQALADTAMKIHQDMKRVDDERMSNDAMNGAVNFELGAKTAAQDLSDRLERGEIKPNDAADEWQKQLTKLKADHIGSLPQSRFSVGAEQRANQIAAGVGLGVGKAIEGARRQQYGADAASTLDSFGKMSTLPNADLDGIFANADATYPVLAQRAGIPLERATKTLQDWKDTTRFRRAQMDLTDVRHDSPGLDSFIERLDKGDLVGSMDPDKRMALAKEAEGYRWQLDQFQQHKADKVEKAAERAVTQAQQQIEAGVPLTADAWQNLRSVTAGTSLAPTFNDLVKNEREVQQVLRMPIDQQEQYLQQRETSLMQQGGTLADKANLTRIRATVDGNRKELETAPLVASQRLYGKAATPLDMQDLVVPGGGQKTAALFQDRAATLAAMRRQFGNRVGFKPLLPQEAAMITRGLSTMAPSAAADLFGQLRKSIDDDDVYRAAMYQIAPDSPVKAQAGMLAAMGQGMTITKNWLTADDKQSSRRVAETMLAGEQIINRSPADRATDGKPQSLFVPEHGAFRGAFVDAVSDLYRGRPAAQESDLQSVMAYYVGKAAETGLVSRDGQADAKLMKEAITATLGDVVNVNGQGSVKAPIGMKGSDFQQRLRDQFAEAVRSNGLPTAVLNDFYHYGVVNYRRDGQYVLTMGGVPVLNPKTHGPMVIDLAPPSIITGSKYRSGADLIPRDRAVKQGAQGGVR